MAHAQHNMHPIESKPQSSAAHFANVGPKLRFITLAAIAVAVTLIIVKTVAWRMTGSVALLGSLLDSVMDFMISVVNFFVVRHALTPADYEHRFGHGKAEALAALAQGAIIILSALFLVKESIARFFIPQQVTHGLVGISVIAFSIFITLALVYAQRRIAKTTGSIAISADSMHYKGDLYMNLGVIFALILSVYGGARFADPILGMIVAGLLLYNAYKIMLEASNQLMDRELPDHEREKIKAIILSHPQVRGLHDLRTRHAGTQKFIQCHVELDRHIALIHAHDISDAIEARIMEAFPESEVLIHQDPEGYEETTKLERS